MPCPSLITWNLPPFGSLKINIDGAWDSSRSWALFGFIARDADGLFVAAMAGLLNDVLSPLHAEALLVCLAMIWATTRGSYSYCFEYDSLQIVNSLRDYSVNLSSVGQIIEDIKALLLTITEVSRVRRQASGITHRLARYGLSLSNETVIGLNPQPFSLWTYWSRKLLSHSMPLL
ncbi:uncharacterized protein LOC126631381 [Malus sylvestris]|uniref:uncharacterized protein LOC126631381 n=1 Tax=Malus sylvestris TaxID=3752 RepID=UPI0007ED8694|nr:uncharacterized protein LOC126631381 [Malus sylvestris]